MHRSAISFSAVLATALISGQALFGQQAVMAGSSLDSPLVSADTRAKLQQVEKRRKELSAHVNELKQQEHIALIKLDKINTKLNVANGALNQQKHALKATDANITDTQEKITRSQTAEEALSSEASRRLREIFEGERLSFLEMMFEVESLQSLLDRFYFQEKIADLDRRVLIELRSKTQSLSAKKDFLGEQRDKLGEMVSEFAKKAMDIAKEKFGQQQVADKLKSQRAFYEQAEQQLAHESSRLETQIQQLETSNRRANKNMATGSGTMALPLKAPVTSPFGWRRHPIFGVRKFHTGVDLAGKNHSPIHAADSGNVLYTGWYGGYGKVVIISHGHNMATLYAHMSKTNVQVSDNVTKGDVIGFEGTTGFSTGPHLHFEVRVDGKPNNPLSYVSQ